jgi:hypothetical protein
MSRLPAALVSLGLWGCAAGGRQVWARGAETYWCDADQGGWRTAGPSAELYADPQASVGPVGALRGAATFVFLDGREFVGDPSKASGSAGLPPPQWPIPREVAGPEAAETRWTWMPSAQPGSSSYAAVERSAVVGDDPPRGPCERLNAGARVRVAFAATYRFVELPAPRTAADPAVITAAQP